MDYCIHCGANTEKGASVCNSKDCQFKQSLKNNLDEVQEGRRAIDKAIRKLKNDLSAGGPGVSTISVSDGRFLGITKQKLQEFLKTCEDSGQDSLIIFIQDGPLAADLPDAN